MGSNSNSNATCLPCCQPSKNKVQPTKEGGPPIEIENLDTDKNTIDDRPAIKKRVLSKDPKQGQGKQGAEAVEEDNGEIDLDNDQAEQSPEVKVKKTFNPVEDGPKKAQKEITRKDLVFNNLIGVNISDMYEFKEILG